MCRWYIYCPATAVTPTTAPASASVADIADVVAASAAGNEQSTTRYPPLDINMIGREIYWTYVRDHSNDLFSDEIKLEWSKNVLTTILFCNQTVD